MNEADTSKLTIPARSHTHAEVHKRHPDHNREPYPHDRTTHSRSRSTNQHNQQMPIMPMTGSNTVYTKPTFANASARTVRCRTNLTKFFELQLEIARATARRAHIPALLSRGFSTQYRPARLQLKDSPAFLKWASTFLN